MNRILLVLASLVMCTAASAQVAFSENFNATTGTALPAGWTQKNIDGKVPHPNMGALATSFGTNAWISRGSTDRVITSTSWYDPVAAANDWVVTPQITIPAANYWLVFQAQSPDPQYLDGFSVKVSTTDTAVASFDTTLLTVNAATTSYEYYAVNLSAYANQNIYIAIVNTSNDKYLLNIDNFEVKVLPAKDAAVTKLSPSAEARNSYAQVGGSGVNLTGTIFNYGSTPITAIPLNWSDGGAPQTHNLTGLNIQPFQSYNFSHNIPVTFSAASTKNIKFWSGLVGDNNLSNDSASTSVSGYTTKPEYKMTFEEGTGTWCGWCPRGTAFMDSMEEVHGNDVSLIAVHNGDPMVVSAYDAGIGDLIPGYPSCVVNREDVIDPEEMFTYYNAHKNDYGYGTAEITGTVSGSTLNATCKFTPSGPMNKSYRTALVITEDHVKGTGYGYSQANYYSGGSTNLFQDGINWKNLPNPVPASKMEYFHVARHISDGFTGTPNSLPQPMVAGTTYTKNYTYNLSSADVAWHTHATLLIINQEDGFIANSAHMQLVLNTASVIKEVEALTFYPNPATTNVTFNISALESANVTLTITNMNGQVVANQTTSLVQGSNSKTVDVSTLASGKYIVTLSSANGRVTAPLSIVR